MKIFKNIIAAAAALSITLSSAVTTAGAAPETGVYGSYSITDAVSYDISVPKTASGDYEYFDDLEEAGQYVRDQINQRIEEVGISIPYYAIDYDAFNEILAETLKETGVSTEGDYLRLSILGYGYGTGSSTSLAYVRYKFAYSTNTEQERELDAKVDEILSSLDLAGKSEYETIKAIYDYIITNVTYASDFEQDVIYSAYGALIDGVAVCQGYAQALYRLLTEAGISCRVVTGTSNGVEHAWNIAAINGTYYLLDSTFDSSFNGRTTYFFLKGTEDFDDFSDDYAHVTGTGDLENIAFLPNYTSAEFKKTYPISDHAYDPNAPEETIYLGDVNMDAMIDAMDASAILREYANLSSNIPTSFDSKQLKAADVNGDGLITAVDASIVLSYYAYLSVGRSYIMLEEYVAENI